MKISDNDLYSLHTAINIAHRLNAYGPALDYRVEDALHFIILALDSVIKNILTSEEKE